MRSVGTDANPYLLIYSLVKTGLEGGVEKVDKDKRPRARFLPGDINTAINYFRQSDLMKKILGEEMKKSL